MNTEVLEPKCVTTFGEWADEDSAVAELKARLDACKLFRYYPEVEGFYLQPRAGVEQKQPRIDLLLVPGPELRMAGWCYGNVGIECKASGVKLGPVLSQAMDYSRAVYTIPDAGGIRVMCDWVFIWPLEKQAGDIASVMDQNRIGAINGHRYPWLNFQTASANMLFVSENGNFNVNPNVRCGKKAGSR